MAIDRRFNESADDDAETHALENAAFCFPRASTSTLRNLVSHDNVGCVVSVDEGSLTISEGSSFYGNTGVVGAVIVASRSNVSLTGTQFLENSYLNPGGCLALRDGSSAFIHSAFFGRNVGNRATAISATSLKRLDISDSHFGQICGDCGGFIFVNHSVDATSAITISNSHLGSFKQFDTPLEDHPRGLLVIDRFHDGHVLLESVDLGRQLGWECNHVDRGDRVGMVVLMDTRNVSFISWNSSYTRTGGALGSGLRFVDSSGRFRIEQALFHRIDCCDVGYGIFLTIPPHHPAPSKLSVIDSEFSSNYFFGGGTILVIGINGAVEVIGSRFIDNKAQNNLSYNNPAGSILSAWEIYSLYVSNLTARNNTADIKDWASTPVLGSLQVALASYVTIEGSTFIANSVGTRKADRGGAVFSSFCDELVVIDCKFEDNIAAGGGAIHAEAIVNLYMIGCSFRNNSAITFGGAVFVVYEKAMIYFENSTFVDNRARIGGAMALGMQWESRITGCAFSENKAELYGGAIAFMHIPTEAVGRTNEFVVCLEMSWVTFLRNTATFGGETLSCMIRQQIC